MIYFIGMSHMIPVLDACSIDERREQISIIYDKEKEPAFLEWNTKEGILPDRLKVANIYVGNFVPHWGAVLALQTAPAIINIAPGFQNLLKTIDSVGGKSILFVFMHGEEYVSMSGKEDSVPHDFYMPWHPELPVSPERQVIPLDVIKRQVAFYLTKAVANFNAIRSCLVGMRVVNVVCPPPASINATNLKYYLLYVKMLNEAIRPLGIESLMPPPETVTPEELLKPEYVGDLVHGNTLYGSRVIAQMNELLQEGAC